MKESLQYIVSRLGKSKFRHEVHTFDSGAVMVDIWVNNYFYVTQIDGNQIGLSLVTEENSFDTIPDKSYNNFEIFKVEFEKILQ